MDEAGRRTAAAVSGLRAENNLLCANFEELQGLYTRLQATAEETKRRLVEEQRERAAIFDEYMLEKRRLEGEMQKREDEVRKIRAEGLQKSDFQQLQLRIREELEAPYIENVKALEATAEAVRTEKERVAREHARDIASLDATVSQLKQSLLSACEQRETDTAMLEKQLKDVEMQRDSLAEENAKLTKTAVDTDVLRASNRQLNAEIESLRAETARAQSELQDVALVADKRVARIKAEHAAAAHEYDTVHRQAKFLQSELRAATDANVALQRDLTQAETKIIALGANAAESSRSMQKMHATDSQRFHEAEKAWEEERCAMQARLEEREQALASTSSRYRADVEAAALESSTRLRDVENVHAETVRGLESKCAELKARIQSLEGAANEASKDFMSRLSEATQNVVTARGDASRAEAETRILQQEVSRLREELAAAEGRIAVARDEASSARDSLHAERGARTDEKLHAESTIGKLRAESARERDSRSLASNDLEACREKLRLERALRAKDRKEFRAEVARQRKQRRQLKETTKAALNELVSAVDIHQVALAEERKRDKIFAEIENIRQRQANFLVPAGL